LPDILLSRIATVITGNRAEDTMQQQQIRRGSAGFINVEFHRREAERLRSKAMANCLKSVKGLARLLLGPTVIVASSMFAALVHGVAESESTDHMAAAQVTLSNPP
jgi:hypothetical protein